MRRPLAPLLAFPLLLGRGKLEAQSTGRRPTIDSISIVTINVFAPREARHNFVFRLANGVRFKTRHGVVERELLFAVGEPYDSARVAETARNLRALAIFRDVEIDTATVAGKFTVSVITSDAWSTKVQLNARSTGGTFTGEVALTEENFLGAGHLVSVSYRDEPDRTAVLVKGQMNRAFGTRAVIGGAFDDLSDGNRGSWVVGLPFRSQLDRKAISLTGEAADQRILQFRDGGLFNTFRRRAVRTTASLAIAPKARSDGYLRLGFLGQVRREEYIHQRDSLLPVPDTVTGAVGVFADWLDSRFMVVTHYNGFAQEEDINLSTRVLASVWLAPSAFGYEETGVAPRVFASTGAIMGRSFVRASLEANGLLTSSSLDSGQVRGTLTLSLRIIDKSATVLHIEAGARKNPPPGLEYDLGHGIGPRAFEPHAFTGNRTLWGILEHRAFLVDQFLGLFGVGFAGFVDYGGAWFDDQAARWGGDVGLGLRIGSTRSRAGNLGRFDIAYKFGDGVTGNRWVFSSGRSFTF